MCIENVNIVFNFSTRELDMCRTHTYFIDLKSLGKSKCQCANENETHSIIDTLHTHTHTCMMWPWTLVMVVLASDFISSTLKCIGIFFSLAMAIVSSSSLNFSVKTPKTNAIPTNASTSIVIKPTARISASTLVSSLTHIRFATH